MKTRERERARELRLLGWSVKEIERELAVSRASVSVWVRDVPLDAVARERLATRVAAGPRVAAVLKRLRSRSQRASYQLDGRRLAHERGAGYAAGCMLHWAEGDKTRNSVRFVNSDPEVLKTFVSFLRREFGVRDGQIAIACNLFADHVERQREIEEFWLSELRLSRTQLRKTIVNRYSKHSQKKRKNKLPYGTCKVLVHSTRIQQTIYGSIQEYGGFERPEWLD